MTYELLKRFLKHLDDKHWCRPNGASQVELHLGVEAGNKSIKKLLKHFESYRLFTMAHEHQKVKQTF